MMGILRRGVDQNDRRLKTVQVAEINFEFPGQNTRIVVWDLYAATHNGAANNTEIVAGALTDG